MDAVSQVLAARSEHADVDGRMIGLSVMAHALFAASIVLLPGMWLGQQESPETEAIMTISLGPGPQGPRTSMSTLDSRPIQTQSLESKKAVEPIRPPAATAPAMIEPKKAAPKKNETKDIAQATDPKSRTPTKGEEVRPGTAVAETNARGQGFGLSAGGGGMSGQLEIANFCCPEYLSRMVQLIHQNWNSRQQASGSTVMKFVVLRDGTLTAIETSRSSGSPLLDQFARRALLLTKQIPPLPAQFTQPTLTVYLSFEYQR